MTKSAAYRQGQASAHTEAHPDNPYMAVPTTGASARAGIPRPLPGHEQQATDWNLGYRDERDVIGLKRYGGRVPQLGDFVQRKGRRVRRPYRH